MDGYKWHAVKGAANVIGLCSTPRSWPRFPRSKDGARVLVAQAETFTRRLNARPVEGSTMPE